MQSLQDQTYCKTANPVTAVRINTFQPSPSESWTLAPKHCMALLVCMIPAMGTALGCRNPASGPSVHKVRGKHTGMEELRVCLEEQSQGNSCSPLQSDNTAWSSRARKVLLGWDTAFAWLGSNWGKVRTAGSIFWLRLWGRYSQNKRSCLKVFQ